MNLLDQFTDGSGQWQWPFCDVFLDGIWCLVGCKVKTCVLLSLLLLDGECEKADRKDADAVVACLEGWAWHEVMVDNIIGQCHIAELTEGWYLCMEVLKEHL